ncbi:HD domain-containing phosphohydrolase [Hydrogenimonas cancrithermarum]|nr:HD domain-containing phosphohydrolase [Hydrogenimonas cancrithermarum]
MGLYQNPPLSFGTADHPKGIFVDLLQSVAEEEGWSVSYVPCEFDGCLKLLSEEKIDLLGPVVKTKEREKYAIFPNEIVISNWGVVYGTSDFVPDTFLSLSDKCVAMLKDDVHASAFMRLMRRFGISYRTKYFHSYEKVFRALQNREADVGIANRFLFLRLGKNYSDVRSSSLYFNPIGATYAIAKNNPLLAKTLQNHLHRLKQDQNTVYHTVVNSYLARGSLQQISPYVFKIIVALLVLLLASITAIWLFRREVRRKTEAYKIAKEEAENHLLQSEYLRRVVNTVKEVNQVLIEPLSIDAKLQKVCDELVENRFYSLVWIGCAQKSGHALYLKYHSNDSSGYLDETFFTTTDPSSDFAKGPSGQSYLQNRTVIQDTQNDPNFRPWRDRARRAGFTYCMATPIRYHLQGEPVGVITVYTSNPAGFSDKEQQLLEEMAGDVGMMLHAQRLHEERERLLHERIENFEQTVLVLNDVIEARDPYTAGHSNRVGEYAVLIARACGCSEEETKQLLEASKVHDIGKIETPDSILLKPGPLTSVEFEIIKQHPETGYKILSRLAFFKEEAQIIRYHHERYDGSGYPEGLKGGEIPRLAQILSIADTFDAMTTNRIYKPKKSKEEALEELEKLAGTWFDPELCRIAVDILKDTKIHEEISQLPSTQLEEARFAYFFKDPLTDLFNQNYLEFTILLSSTLVPKKTKIYALTLKAFTQYNREKSWSEGNTLLKTIADRLKSSLKDRKIFRIQGDDFIILTSKPLPSDLPESLKRELLENTGIDIALIDGGYVREYDSKRLYSFVRSL